MGVGYGLGPAVALVGGVAGGPAGVVGLTVGLSLAAGWVAVRPWADWRRTKNGPRAGAHGP